MSFLILKDQFIADIPLSPEYRNSQGITYAILKKA